MSKESRRRFAEKRDRIQQSEAAGRASRWTLRRAGDPKPDSRDTRGRFRSSNDPPDPKWFKDHQAEDHGKKGWWPF